MNFYKNKIKPAGEKQSGITFNATHQKIFRAMKLTFVMVTLFCIQIHAAAVSQKITLNQRNVSLDKVLKEIKRQTGYFFLYDLDLIQEKSKPVNINVTNSSIEEVMAQTLKAQPFTWEMKANTILIKPVTAQAADAKAKGIDIYGKVTDETGAPLPGANIKVEGTNLIAVTNINGEYTLKNVDENATLLISYIGYASMEIKARSVTATIALSSKAGVLNDVVITGYTSYSRNQSTNATSLVTSEKINQVPGLTVDQILQGRVPGMSVISSSGQPGQSAAVVIRGISSVNGSSTPLFVLDGVPIEAGYFQTINAEDIESATVLKDASAKALYGSRGTNGVIVLTTKKGKTGKVEVQYSSQYGVSNLSRPNFTMMNTAQRLQFEEEVGTGFNGQIASRNIGPGWTYSPKNPTYAAGTPATRARADAILDSLKGINTDWRDMFFQKGRFQEQNVSVSGGNEGLKFYNSLNYYKQDGVAKRTGLERYALRSNLDYKSGNFSGSTNVYLGYSSSSFTEGEGSTSSGTAMSAVYYALPYEYPYTPDGVLVPASSRTSYPIYDQREGSLALERLLNSTNKTDQLKTIIGVSFGYQITPDLKATTRAGIDYRNSTDAAFINPDSYYGSRSTANTLGGKGRYDEGTRRNFNVISTTGLTYAKVFNKVHNIEVSGFYEYLYNNYNTFSFSGFGLDGREPETPASITNSATYLPIVGGSKTSSALASFMGVARYTFEDKYTINGSYRIDGSTKVAPKNKWHGFYSLGANWIAKKETFLKDVDFISDLRFRASYGVTASQFSSSNDYPYLATYAANTSYGGNTGIRPTNPGNPDYDWEYVHELNIGFDLNLFKTERLRLSADIYNRITSNMFFSQPLSAVSGFPDGIPLSSGKMRNRGIEFDVSGDIIKKRNLTWTVGANAGYNKNTILYLTPLADLLLDGDTRVFKVGMPYGTYYAPDWAGVNPQTGEAQYYNLDGSITTTYNATAQNATNSGSLYPTFTGGFNTDIRYKDFTVTALFSFVSGVKRWNNEDLYNENQRYATSNQSVRMLNDIWKKPGDIATLQRFDIPRNFTSKDIQDASYLRFRNLKVGYNVPKTIITRLKYLKGISIFAQAENLYTWTGWRGLDPENNAVYGRFQYPNTRTYTAGLNVKF